jgi:aminoglycoside/choline kinase family phosphotransferase
VRGYRDIFPEIPLPSPACYFSDFDAARGQGIIIMDDLAARGVTFCHALKPQSPEQVARRLGVLAKFHAASWDSDALRPGGKWGDLADFFDVMRGFFERYSELAVWQGYVDLPRGAATSVRFHDRDWLVRSWGRLTAYAQQLPHCILHGDIHLGNLYIDTDGTPGFFDTLASRGPGMLEVSYHVSAALDSAERPGAEVALVQHYLEELRRAGADAPTLDDAIRQYGIFLLYGHFIWMTTDAYRQTEAVNTANAARVSSAMLDHDTIGLLEGLDEAC